MNWILTCTVQRKANNEFFKEEACHELCILDLLRNSPGSNSYCLHIFGHANIFFFNFYPERNVLSAFLKCRVVSGSISQQLLLRHWLVQQNAFKVSSVVSNGGASCSAFLSEETYPGKHSAWWDLCLTSYSLCPFERVFTFHAFVYEKSFPVLLWVQLRACIRSTSR